MSITPWELCHQDCQTFTKSNSSWPTRCGISCMDIPCTPTQRINMIPSIHRRSRISHMYLQYAGDTDVCRSNQTISQR